MVGPFMLYLHFSKMVLIVHKLFAYKFKFIYIEIIINSNFNVK